MDIILILATIAALEIIGCKMRERHEMQETQKLQQRNHK